MRPFLAVSLLALLLCVSLSNAELVNPRKFDPDEKISAMSVRPYIGHFKPNELARVQVTGQGESNLGLYIFDAQGNCVFVDDRSGPSFCDEMYVEWISDAAGKYNLEVRNAGIERNKFALVIR